MLLSATPASAVNWSKLPLHDPKQCYIKFTGYMRRMFSQVEAKFIPAEQLIAVQKRRLAAMPVRDLSKHPETVAFLKTHPVYLSLTTSPERIQKLHHTLETLDLSNVQKIFLNLPERFGRTGEVYQIPLEILDHPKIEILRGSVDEGPVMKLLPGVEQAKSENPAAYVLTVDDDIGYPRGMVNEMIYAASQRPGSAISGGGGRYSFFGVPFSDASSGAAVVKVDRGRLVPIEVVEGYGAVIYPASDVPVERIRAWSASCKACFHSDDLVISYALSRSKIPKYRVETHYHQINKQISYAYGHLGDALSKGAGKAADEGAKTSVHYENYQRAFDHLSRE